MNDHWGYVLTEHSYILCHHSTTILDRNCITSVTCKQVRKQENAVRSFYKKGKQSEKKMKSEKENNAHTQKKNGQASVCKLYVLPISTLTGFNTIHIEPTKFHYPSWNYFINIYINEIHKYIKRQLCFIAIQSIISIILKHYRSKLYDFWSTRIHVQCQCTLFKLKSISLETRFVLGNIHSGWIKYN